MQDEIAIIKEMAEVFKALGDPTRLKIIGLLAKRNSESFCVIDLAEKLGMTQPAVSQHLKVLKNIKLLEPNRKGNHVFYSINLETMNSIKEGFDYIYNLTFEECDDESWLKS